MENEKNCYDKMKEEQREVNEEEIEEFLDSYNRWHYIKEPKLVRK